MVVYWFGTLDELTNKDKDILLVSKLPSASECVCLPKLDINMNWNDKLDINSQLLLVVWYNDKGYENITYICMYAFIACITSMLGDTWRGDILCMYFQGSLNYLL